MGKPDTFTLEEAIAHLKNGAHILSKNYHDGGGRRYWLRDSNQDDICELSKAEFETIRSVINLSCQEVMSSDEAFWYEVEK